jgi:subfamily B ATP-binding cassette protein HlyB/CyaB
MDSALECFVAVARYHGVDLSADRLKHDFAVAENDSIDRLLPSIARKTGFRAKALKLKWRDLSRLGDAYPMIVRLVDGRRVIAIGMRDERLGIVDPTSKQPEAVLFRLPTLTARRRERDSRAARRAARQPSP